MNRYEFMEQLKRLLSDIPEGDREEVLEYYDHYFEDGGVENEAAVIRELGSPGRVAAEIKAGLNLDAEDLEYTDRGCHNGRLDSEEQNLPSKGSSKKINKGMDDGVKKLLLIAAIVVSFPLWGALLGGLFSLFMGILGVVLAVILITLFGGIGIILASIVLAVSGIVQMTASVPLGIVVLGAGMILLAAGLLLVKGFAWFTFKALPSVVRLGLDGINRIFHRNRKGEAQ